MMPVTDRILQGQANVHSVELSENRRVYPYAK